MIRWGFIGEAQLSAFRNQLGGVGRSNFGRTAARALHHTIHGAQQSLDHPGNTIGMI